MVVIFNGSHALGLHFLPLVAAEYTESVKVYAEVTFPSEWGLGRLKKPVVFKGSLLHLVPM